MFGSFGIISPSSSTFVSRILLSQILFIVAFAQVSALNNAEAIPEPYSLEVTGGCEDAQVISGPFYPPVQIIANNKQGTIGYYNSECYIFTTDKPAWFIVTPTSEFPMTVSTCNSNTTIDTVVSIFVNGSCSALQCVSYSDDNCDIYGYASSVTFNAVIGTPYLVAVSGYDGSVGTFSLSIAQVPPSTCATAYPIIPGDAIMQTINEQPVISNDPCGVVTGKPGFWFVLGDLSATTTATVSTCSADTDFDTIITVYSGSCAMQSCVASNDDYPCPITGFSISSELTFTPSVTETYYVVVSAFGTPQGNFVLTLSQP